MTTDLNQIVERVAAFEREVHELFTQFETAPSRVIALSDTRRQVTILNLKQSELFEEAVSAVEVGLYRPAIVMAWAGFMDFVQEKLASDGFVALHGARPKWRGITTLEELRDTHTEFAMLDAARETGLLTKGEHKSLLGLLSQRNEAAHPSGYKPGLNEAIGYISQLLNRIPTIGQRKL